MDEDARFARMISSMAHELRSPLTSVKGFSATLMKHWDRFTDDQRKEFIAAVHGDAERMARIVSELLDIARTEAGRLELKESRFDLGEAVSEAAAEAASLPGGDRILFDIEEGLMVVWDRDRIVYIARNLLENAVRFSQDGPVRVTVKSSSGGAVLLTVSDEGVGISADRLPRLFEEAGPRGQGATPRGTGFGLYLAKRVLGTGGGTVSVESEVDKGSTFTIHLPSEAS
jgi:signal transduction histidine kinase